MKKFNLLIFLMMCSWVTVAEIDEARKQYLLNMLKHDCGSCHGLSLKGGLGPALTAQALKSRSDSVLMLTILKGRSGTPMPPFESLLSEEEVKWLIKILRRENS